MKRLNEHNDNDYARRIREVEELMRKNKVTIDFVGHRTRVTISGKDLSCMSTIFPRFTDDEYLYLEE